jgi:RNase P/RNase MRP subunit p29
MTQDAATVTFPAGKVIVEKARVLVNDQEVAKVPEETKVVAVDYTGGTLTITADGTKVHEAKHSK